MTLQQWNTLFPETIRWFSENKRLEFAARLPDMQRVYSVRLPERIVAQLLKHNERRSNGFHNPPLV